jgi:hypothetical protein
MTRHHAPFYLRTRTYARSLPTLTRTYARNIHAPIRLARAHMRASCASLIGRCRCRQPHEEDKSDRTSAKFTIFSFAFSHIVLLTLFKPYHLIFSAPSRTWFGLGLDRSWTAPLRIIRTIQHMRHSRAFSRLARAHFLALYAICAPHPYHSHIIASHPGNTIHTRVTLAIRHATLHSRAFTHSARTFSRLARTMRATSHASRTSTQ